MVVSGLVNFNQHAVAAFGVDENDLAAVRAGGGRIGEELIALGLQHGHIFQNVVGAEADVVDATFAVLFQIFCDGAFAVQRVYQLNLCASDREKGRGGFGGFHIFRAVEGQAEVFQEAADGFLQVGNGDGDMVEMGNHQSLKEGGEPQRGGILAG